MGGMVEDGGCGVGCGGRGLCLRGGGGEWGSDSERDGVMGGVRGVGGGGCQRGTHHLICI